MKPHRLALPLVAVASLALTACGPLVTEEDMAEIEQARAESSSSPAAPEPAPEPDNCLDVPAAMVDAIAFGKLDGDEFAAGEAAAVRSEDHEKVFVVAMEFSVDGEPQGVGAWATNGLEGGGLVMAADGMANTFSVYPDAATTEAGINAASPAVAAAKDCLDG